MVARLTLFCLAAGLTAAEAAPVKTLLEWTFDQPGNLKGWQPNGAMGGPKIVDGALRGTCNDWDPFLTSGQFDLAARPWQVVEIELLSNLAGQGQLFYSNTMDSPYAGLFPEKQIGFQVAASTDWQTVRIQPFWQGEKKIIHLRVDLFDKQQYAIRAIRIVEPDAGPTVTTSSWQFGQGLAGWSVDGLAEPRVADQAIQLTADPAGLLRSPGLAVDTTDYTYVAVRMRAGQPGTGTVVWATDSVSGLKQLRFPVRGDGRWHTYNVDVGGSSAWAGKLIALGLRPSSTAGDAVAVQSLQLTIDPLGEPDLDLLYFGQAEAVARAGRPVEVLARLVNTGGETATGVTATLTAPPGVRVAPVAGPAPEFEFQVPDGFRFTVEAPQAGDVPLALQLAGPGVPRQSFTATLRIGAAVNLPKADYVPAPQPLKTDYQVGSYYFPGWATADRWARIDRVAPERRPILGWYDEANPEIIDWQIKWAVEHGVTFFLVDWYWSQGGMHLRHWLDSLEKARYQHQIKWALMWANHNAPNTHSAEDWKKVTQYWLDHYLKQPNYLHVDGKPVIYMWAPSNIRRDVGGSAEAAKLYAMSQEMAKAAGLPGLTFIATSGGYAPGALEEAKTLKAEGYYGRTSYHWWGDAPNLSPDPRRFPYASVVERSRPTWEIFEATLKQAGLVFQPVADTGWADQPWNNSRVIHDRTPELFEKLLRDAKAYLDARQDKFLILAPWNEWGEGSYIEPNLEYGFEMLEAIRRVFGDGSPHTPDVTPQDLGLGPYDLPMATPRNVTAWSFDAGAEGWGPMMGIAAFEAKDGAIYARTGSRDPALSSPSLAVRANKFKYLVVKARLKQAVATDDFFQLFWSTASRTATEQTSAKVKMIPDGQVHTYVFPLAENKLWAGQVGLLRLDLGSGMDTEVWIDEIRFAEEAPAG